MLLRDQSINVLLTIETHFPGEFRDPEAVTVEMASRIGHLPESIRVSSLAWLLAGNRWRTYSASGFPLASDDPRLLLSAPEPVAPRRRRR